MGIKSFLGFGNGGGRQGDTFGKAGTERQERTRADKFIGQSYGSSGPDFSNDELVNMPPGRGRVTRPKGRRR